MGEVAELDALEKSVLVGRLCDFYSPVIPDSAECWVSVDFIFKCSFYLTAHDEDNHEICYFAC